MGSRSVHAALVFVSILAAVPRVAWYRSHQPDLPPDSYGYLNVAREWRGERAPGGWDDRSQLPWDNQAARTPGYPLFLDLVFTLTRHSPTPEAALTAPRRLLVGTPAREHHFRHLQTDENVRAVQAAHHTLGVAATAIALLTVFRWTGSVLVAVASSLVAIGWNPVWIITYEPSVMTETLAGVLLVVTVWLASLRSAICERIAAAVCGLAVVVRPPMLLASMPILAYLVWTRRHDGPSALTILIAPLVLVGLVIVNNGVRYRYWGLASAGGATLMSHAARHPEGLREPLTDLGHRIRGNQFGGQVLLYVLSVEDHWAYRDAAGEVGRAAFAYILDHPLWYLASVAEATIDFFSPPLRLVPGEMNLVRARFPTVWLVISGFGELLIIAGVAAVFMRLPGVVKVGPMVFLVSGIGLALVAHTENRRFAAPIVPLVLMSGVTALDFARRRIAGGQTATPR